MQQAVRAVVFESFSDRPIWRELTEVEFLAAVDSEQELFIAAIDFAVALDFAETGGRNIFGVEAARIGERVVMAEDLGVVVFDGGGMHHRWSELGRRHPARWSRVVDDSVATKSTAELSPQSFGVDL